MPTIEAQDEGPEPADEATGPQAATAPVASSVDGDAEDGGVAEEAVAADAGGAEAGDGGAGNAVFVILHFAPIVV